MSISNQVKPYKKPLHHRNDSDELDVFEASRYFSGVNEVLTYNSINIIKNSTREENRGCKKGGRISLDIQAMRNSNPSQSDHLKENRSKEKKHKQPSSPGGKLASFLSSLFSQTPSKKKNTKSVTSQSMREKDEIPGGRRRRTSISHFGSTFSKDSKSFYSVSSSGFRTPPPYANADTPIKACTDICYSSNHFEHKQVVPLSKHSIVNIDKEFKVMIDEILEKPKNVNGFLDKNEEEKEFKKFDVVDDGAESDSSSDLFELESYDFRYCSSGLPVYETTHMDTIKRGPSISSGTI